MEARATRSFPVFLPLALLASALYGGTPVFAGDPQWMEVRSPNFSVVTDAGERRGREVAMRFEQMRAPRSEGYPDQSLLCLPSAFSIVRRRDSRYPLWLIPSHCNSIFLWIPFFGGAACQHRFADLLTIH